MQKLCRFIIEDLNCKATVSCRNIFRFCFNNNNGQTNFSILHCRKYREKQWNEYSNWYGWRESVSYAPKIDWQKVREFCILIVILDRFEFVCIVSTNKNKKQRFILFVFRKYCYAPCVGILWVLICINFDTIVEP